MSTQSVVFYSDDAIHIAFWRNVMLMDDAGDLTMQQAMHIESGYAQMARRFPQGFVACAFVRPGVPVSGQAVRTKLTQVLREHEHVLLRLTTVIEEPGIRGQMMRTVLRGMNALTRKNSLHTCASAEAAVETMLPLVARQAGESNTRQLMSKMIERTRGGYRPARSTASQAML